MASRNRWIWHLWLSCNHPFQTKFPAAFQNYLERQSCRKFPATFLKPVTLGKTALFHATFTSTMRLVGFGFHARSIFMRKKCAKCSNSVFHVSSHFFTPFSHFVRAFFTLVCRKETKHVKTVTDFSNGELRHFRLSDKTWDFCQSPFFPCDLAF